MVGRTNARCEARFPTAHYQKCTCLRHQQKQRARLSSCPSVEIQSKLSLTSADLPEQEQVSELASPQEPVQARLGESELPLGLWPAQEQRLWVLQGPWQALSLQEQGWQERLSSHQPWGPQLPWLVHPAWLHPL